jgi:hypothetical protein
MPAFVPTYIQPTIPIGGQTQTFQYGVAQAISQTQLTNLFPPTSLNPSQNCFEFINANNDGFRLRHKTLSTDTIGTLTLESFTAGALPGTVFMTFNSSGISLTNIQTNVISGNSSTPTIAAGTGAGTSPTVSVTGTELSGVISITTGTTPTGSAVIATITVPVALPGTSNGIIITPANAATANLAVTAIPYAIMASTTTFTLNSTGALTGSTAYKWNFILIG